jgi:hypothetical protein
MTPMSLFLNLALLRTVKLIFTTAYGYLRIGISYPKSSMSAMNL